MPVLIESPFYNAESVKLNNAERCVSKTMGKCCWKYVREGWKPRQLAQVPLLFDGGSAANDCDHCNVVLSDIWRYMSMGAIGLLAVMLTGRALGPMATGRPVLATRYKPSKISLYFANEIWPRGRKKQNSSKFVHRPLFKGRFSVWKGG